MTFTVTYRGADGALREEAVEAAGRAECFAQMKARGIVPVSVREGASLGERASRPFRSRAKTSPRNAQDARCLSGGGKLKSSILNLKSAIFLAAVLAAAGGVWWWLSADKDGSIVLPKYGTSEKNGKHAAPQVRTAKPKVAQQQHPAFAVPVTNILRETAKIHKPPTVTNYLVGITITTNKPKNIFRSATEKMLYSIFSTPLGSPPPPMCRIPLRDKAELEAILNATFEQSNDKDEKRKEMEQTVDAARKVFKDYIDKGGKPDEFMDYFRDELAKYHEDWKMAQKVAMAACRDEDPEVARQMIEEINSRLAEKGIKPVNVPPKYRERMGLEPIGKEAN